MPEMLGGRADSGPHSVPVWEVRRVKDERGRREWARDVLASKKWVRMEDSGCVDDEGRPILERVGGFDGGVLRRRSPSNLKIMYVERFGFRRRRRGGYYSK